MSPPQWRSGLVPLRFGCALVTAVVRGGTHQALSSTSDMSSKEGLYVCAVPGFKPTSDSLC